MIDRRDFLKLSATLGIGLPLSGCGDDPELRAGATSLTGDGPYDGFVLIIGAGAAGMAAGHLLKRAGVDFTIVEAADTHGGRIKRTLDFVDFPISLGGEWLHVPPDELDRIVADDRVDVTTETTGYRSTDEVARWDGKQLVTGPMGADADSDLKFVGSSWLDFFDEFVVPRIANRMFFGKQIVRIAEDRELLQATAASGEVYDVEAVIVTVPIEVIRRGDLSFDLPLSAEKVQAFRDAKVWGGMKVFLEFSDRFYPAFIEFPDSYTGDGQRLYYNAAHGQESKANVLGLFSVGAQAEPYQRLSDPELRDHILAELDELFDGAASRSYIQHVAQNWSDEPFIHQAYLADSADRRTPPELAEPIDGRVYFAGEAYTQGDDWGGVHNAARSARMAVDNILQSWGHPPLDG